MCTDFKNSVLVKVEKKIKEVLLAERSDGTQRLVVSLWEIYLFATCKLSVHCRAYEQMAWLGK